MSTAILFGNAYLGIRDCGHLCVSDRIMRGSSTNMRIDGWMEQCGECQGHTMCCKICEARRRAA